MIVNARTAQQVRAAVLLLLGFSMPLVVRADSASAHSARESILASFAQSQRTSPPAAYLSAISYLDNFGIDSDGLPIWHWALAYEDKAPDIYSRHDAEFGLYSDELPLVVHSFFWASRRLRLQDIRILLPAPGQLWVSSPDLGGGIRMAPYVTGKFLPAMQTRSMMTAFWTDGDWQAIDRQGQILNANSKRRDLVQAIRPLDDGSLPSALFGGGDGQWVVMWGPKRAQCSENVQDICQRIADIGQSGQVVRNITFGEDGGWLILYGRNGGYYHQLPSPMLERWKSLGARNVSIESAELLPGGGWFIKAGRSPAQ